MVEFRKLDDRVPFARQLGESRAPIGFFNTFDVTPGAAGFKDPHDRSDTDGDS